MLYKLSSFFFKIRTKAKNKSRKGGETKLTLSAFAKIPSFPQKSFHLKLSEVFFFSKLSSQWALTASLAAPSNSLSWEMEVFLPCSRYNSIAICPWGNQSTGATLTASAQLKPQLNPEWYARGKVRTNSPAFWTHR